jgi:hypothetical protein
VANGHEPIADDELLYRRVPESYYDAAAGRPLHTAFGPHKTRDTTGLSLARAKYKTAAQAAHCPQVGKAYYIAVLRAADVRRAGMAIEPRPTADDPAHCELSDLRADNYRETVTLERQRKLVELCLEIQGPFVSQAAPDTGP